MSLYDDAKRTTESCSQSMPPEHQATVRDYLELKALTCRPTSVRNIAYAVRDYLDFIEGDLARPGVQTLRRFATHETTTLGLATAYYRTMIVKPFLSWLRGERIADDEAAALTTRAPSLMPSADHLVHDHEWQAIAEPTVSCPRRHLMHERASVSIRSEDARVARDNWRAEAMLRPDWQDQERRQYASLCGALPLGLLGGEGADVAVGRSRGPSSGVN